MSSMHTQPPPPAALEPRLAALRRTASTRLGPEVLAIFEHFIQETIRNGLGRDAPAVGDAAPAFTLRDAAGRPAALADLWRPGPVAVVFFRGGWCRYCVEMLTALRDVLPAVSALGAQVVAVSPQTPAANAATAERLGLPFPLLSDPGATVATAWKLAHGLDLTMRRLFLELGRDLPAHNGDTSWLLPLPAAFVIDRSGRIAWRFVHGDYSRRAEPADILDALRRLHHPG